MTPALDPRPVFEKDGAWFVQDGCGRIVAGPFHSKNDADKWHEQWESTCACGYNGADGLTRVGEEGRGSWVCPRCLAVIYGVDRSKEEVFRLLWGSKP
jgi:hypothetical protein